MRNDLSTPERLLSIAARLSEIEAEIGEIGFTGTNAVLGLSHMLAMQVRDDARQNVNTARWSLKGMAQELRETEAAE